MFHLRSFFLFSFLMISAMACSEARLELMPEEYVNIQSKGEFCTLSPEDVNRKTNFLFIVDKSGSNGQSDPGAEKRAGNIDRFYQDNKDNDAFRWGMITYQNANARAEIYDGGQDAPIFTDVEEDVNTAIDSLRNGDAGSTPYRAALQLARRAILDDIERYPEMDNVYMLFFITDGVPTDYTSDEALFADVEDLISILDNRIFLSSAFYGPDNGGAERRVEKMAEVGKGKYVNFNDTDELDFNDLIVLPTKEPWQMKDNLMLVYNLNSTICEDGSVNADSDADGLCDQDEPKYGFNPTSRYSVPRGYEQFADSWHGYGDYFRWRAVVYGEALPRCDDRSDEDKDFLTACEESYIVNASPKGTDWQSGNPKDFDTDNDVYLDGIETLVFKYQNRGAGAMDDSNMLLSYDGEPESAGTQVREHRNPLAFDPNAEKYDIRITMTGFSPLGQTCYKYRQQSMRVYPTKKVLPGNTHPGLEHEAGENAVLVYFVQTPHRDPKGEKSKVLMWSVQKLFNSQTASNALGTSAGLKINEQIFRQYKPPRN